MYREREGEREREILYKFKQFRHRYQTHPYTPVACASERARYSCCSFSIAGSFELWYHLP